CGVWIRQHRLQYWREHCSDCLRHADGSRAPARRVHIVGGRQFDLRFHRDIRIFAARSALNDIFDPRAPLVLASLVSGEDNAAFARKDFTMKLCRYDNDRLGIVRGELVHDVTAAQTEIRNAAPYDMNGDAVIAALPQWRERLERLADQMPGKPLAYVRLLAPVARPTKLSCAPTNYQAHISEMATAAAPPRSQGVTPQSSKIGEAGMFLKANSALVGRAEGIAIRFPDRRNDHEAEIVMVIGKTGSDIPRARALDHVAAYCLGLDMTVRGRED